MKSCHLKNTATVPTLELSPEEVYRPTREELIMAYIVSISAVILALGVMQEHCGSGHVEADLGSDRYGEDAA